MKHLQLTLLFLFTLSATHAQHAKLDAEAFYDLIDDGQSTYPITDGLACTTFESTGSGGWIPLNGTPELLQITGWHCSVACTQGNDLCDSALRDAILMVGGGTNSLGQPIGEGVYKQCYFQSGLTYEICAYFSMTGSGPIGVLNFALGNNLSPFVYKDTCQSTPPNPLLQIVGTGNSNTSNGYTDFMFTPTKNYSYLAIYCTAQAGGSYTTVLTGLDVIMKAPCTTPSITSASGVPGNQAKITFSPIPGVSAYDFNLLDPTTGNVLYDAIGTFSPTYDPRTQTTFPTTASATIGYFPAGSYKVVMRSENIPSCSGGYSAWSTPSGVFTISN